MSAGPGFRLSYLPASTTAWRGTVQTWDVCLVESGGAAWRYRSVRRETAAGTVRLKEPGERFSTEPTAGAVQPTSYRMLHVDTAWLMAGGLTLRGGPPHLKACEVEGALASHLGDLLARATTATTLLEQSTHVRAVVEAGLLRNLERGPLPALRAGDTRGLDRVREFILEHAEREVPLRWLARMADMHEVALVRAFRRRFGVPPHQMQLDERVRRARVLLDAGLMGTQVALQVGFYDQSHLTRHFKRIVGISPGRYAATRVPSVVRAPGREAAGPGAWAAPA